MAPSPIKLVEPFKDFAALFWVVVDDEGAVEVDVEVDDDEGDDDDDEAEVVVVIGTEKKDNEGCPDAWLQNSWPRVSIVDTWSEQFPNTQSTSWAG